MKVLVQLRVLQPNPLRDFHVDPIDEENVAQLTHSIKEDGFWGGVVVRERDGRYQIAAGHHRVAAAHKAGIREADVFCLAPGKDDDDAMVRVYARENATQRGNTSTAIMGSVAASLRFIAKSVLCGGSHKFVGTSHAEILGNLQSSKGLGEDVLAAHLADVPGCTLSNLRQALGALKASGDYARIISEVREEIERENKEALAALAKAEAERIRADAAAAKAEAERKAAAQRAKQAKEEAESKRAEEDRQRAEAEAKLAAKRAEEAQRESAKFDALRVTRDATIKADESARKRERTFDLEGVAQHLKNAHQLDLFRTLVTGEGIRPYLAVDKQAALARALVALAKKNGQELSGRFIRENVTSMVLQARNAQQTLSKAEAERRDMQHKMRLLTEDFSRHLRGLAATGLKIETMLKAWPRGVPVPIAPGFRADLDAAKKAILLLDKRV